MRTVQPGFTDPATIQTLRITIAADAGAGTRARHAACKQTSSSGWRRFPASHRPPSSATSRWTSPRAPSPRRRARLWRTQLPIPRTIKFISPGLFRTLGTPLVAGRDLTWVEIYEQRNVTLVSERLAREEWSSASAAIGKRMHVGISGPWQEVVGVVADIYDDGADKKPSAIVYWPARASAVHDRAADSATFGGLRDSKQQNEHGELHPRYSTGRVGGQSRPPDRAGSPAP